MNMILRWTAMASLTVITGLGETAGPIKQQAYVKASNSGMYDQFGRSGGGIALAGDTLVVGAPGEDSPAKGIDGDQGDGLDPTPRNPAEGFDSGAVYVFWSYGSGWAQQAYLKSSDTAVNDIFGRAVAISGDTVVVSALGADGKEDGVRFDGAVYVFVRQGTAWRQEARVTIPGLNSSTGFGGSLAISGDTLVVGVPSDSDPLGTKVGSSENNDRLLAGAAYVFVRDRGKWTRQARLEASNFRYQLKFGTSVAISGETLIVGAIGDGSAAGGVDGDQTDHSMISAGAAYVFVREGTKWSQQAYLKATKPAEFDEFGTSVAISGDTAVVGAARAGKIGTAKGQKDDGPGAAFVFARDGGKWKSQVTLMPPQFEGGEEFGCSVAISGEHLVVGAKKTRERSDKRRNYPGEAYLFTRKAGNWDLGTSIRASNAGDGDEFGGAVAISGGTVAVAAAKEDGFARGLDGDQSQKNDGNEDSGAAYVFVMPGAEKEGAPSAAAGAGKGTLEQRMFGYWATDWDAMAKSWQPLAEQMAGLDLSAKTEESKAAAVRAVVEELKEVFGVCSMEIKKGEMMDYHYPGNPDKKIYRVKSQDDAANTIELEVTSGDQKPTTIRIVFAGDQLTLSEPMEEQGLSIVYRRIDAAAFEARGKAAAESKLFKKQGGSSQDSEPVKGKASGKK